MEIKKIPTKVVKVTQVINLPKKEKVDKQIKNKRLGKIRKNGGRVVREKIKKILNPEMSRRNQQREKTEGQVKKRQKRSLKKNISHIKILILSHC